MKVLHLPSNIASQISITVRSLCNIGVDARGLIKTAHSLEDTQDIEVLPSITASRYSIKRILQKISRWHSAFEALKWADIVHWHYSRHLFPMELDLRYVSFANKACVVEFWGSDIRIPEIASAHNPYIADMFKLYPRLAHGRRKKSRKAQYKFARYDFECLAPDPETASYIQKDIWPSPYRSRQRLIISDFTPNYPEPEKKCPMIVHVPSNKATKGTDAVLRAVHQLKSKYNFDFQLVHGVQHSKALEIMCKCDIMIDQLVIGGHGLAALESMAFGKPTVCYINSSFFPDYPDDLPIVNANQENLTDVLGGLLENGEKRNEIGRLSRAYIEKYHDAHKIARDLVAIYQELLEKKV